LKKERKQNQMKKKISERLAKTKVLVCEGLLIDGSEKNMKLFRSKKCHKMTALKNKYDNFLEKKE